MEVYGDSYTEGVDVNYQNSWPSLLSQKINCRVINFGVEGYGTDQSYLRYKIHEKITKVVELLYYYISIIMII